MLVRTMRHSSTWPLENSLDSEKIKLPSSRTQQLFEVSTKALAGAKSLGGFLYSAVNKAGKTVVEASAKIKKTVEENHVDYNVPIPSLNFQFD
ncbi:hypothetical protein KQX54_017635 [Cotesia glomerata]|uniref:Uncharacterized protein n=1 Tax=Cotesia glomerata TaxID=32391 RepID=A0AAV7I3L9_COTGL|nr:hypothetical protein KQX54_017635 [Cotesia glomerata]